MPTQVSVDPSRRVSQKVYRRRRFVVLGIGGTLLLAILYVAGSLLTPVPATAASVTHEKSIVQPAAQLAWPATARRP